MSAIKNISLYIPHVFPNFDKDYVAKSFNDIGEISQIDFVAKQDRNGKNFNAVYVHFNKWYNNKDNRDFQYNIVENGSDKWYHDNSQYYWIVLPNTAKKQIPGERKARIDLGEAKSISAPRPSKSLLPLLTLIPSKVSSKKPTYAEAAVKLSAKTLEEANKSLEINFDEVAAFESEIEAEMDEIEDLLEADDANLVSIDVRYVQQLEEENWTMNLEIAQLRAALINMDQMYQAEAAKVRAFASSVEL